MGDNGVDDVRLVRAAVVISELKKINLLLTSFIEEFGLVKDFDVWAVDKVKKEYVGST